MPKFPVRFYQRHSKALLIGLLLSFPLCYRAAETMPSKNDIEAWIPGNSEIRREYEAYKEMFGAEEIVLIGFERDRVDEKLIESVRERLARLDSIKSCWSPGSLRLQMSNLGVAKAEIERRLSGVAESDDGKIAGLLVTLSPSGMANRMGTVAEIRGVLDYCELGGDETHLAGAPVVVAELDRLGSRKNNKQFFSITLGICLILLFATVRDWRVTFSLLFLLVWGINATLASIKWCGGEMNFILSALPVMVMVFSMAVCIHWLHYYRRAAEDGEPDPVSAAFRTALRPCLLATATTAIGLVSLCASDIMPVQQFGIAAAGGSIVALMVGLLFTPAVVAFWNYRPAAENSNRWFDRLSDGILGNSRKLVVATGLLVAVLGVGLSMLSSKIDPLDFLPANSKVRQDVAIVDKELIKGTSIEVVVEFDDEQLPFMKKLDAIREIEKKIISHPQIATTLSASFFFPKQAPDGAWAVMTLLDRARSEGSGTGFLAEGERFWRLSARVEEDAKLSVVELSNDLEQQFASGGPLGAKISATGIHPLLEEAQAAIFYGFWESFLTAFLIITCVMIVALRSLRIGLVAMIPNLTPIAIVFGAMGWMGIPIDIGMMMTASIALGIAVDGTFHFLISHRSATAAGGDSAMAAGFALRKTGQPILYAAAIAGIGMFALAISPFAPTARFGILMGLLMLAAVIGDLILLPALLAIRGKIKKPAETTVHQITRRAG